jgi:hypothetical protein
VRARGIEAVEAQLRRRGCEVSPAGPGAAGDLLVHRPGGGPSILVKVRCLRKPIGWIVDPGPAGGGLCYVLTLVPMDGGPDRFFIMSEGEVVAEVARQRARLARTPDYVFQGFNFSAALPYEGRWEALLR